MYKRFCRCGQNVHFQWLLSPSIATEGKNWNIARIIPVYLYICLVNLELFKIQSFCLGWDLFCRCGEVVKVNLEVDMIPPRRLVALSLHVCLIVGGEWKVSKSVFKNLFHGDYNSLCQCPNYRQDRSLSSRSLILCRTSYSALIFVISGHDFQFIFLE